MDLEPVVCWLGWHRYFDATRFVFGKGKIFMGLRSEPVPRRIEWEKVKRKPSRTEDHFRPAFDLRLSGP